VFEWAGRGPGAVQPAVAELAPRQRAAPGAAGAEQPAAGIHAS
jgi:hypothetical protein